MKSPAGNIRKKNGRCQGRHTASLYFLLAFGCAFPLSSPALADWSLVTADFSTQPKLAIVEWNLKDSLAYTNDSGKVTSVATRQIVSVTSDRKPAAADAAWVLTLRNGDTLIGSPAGMSDQFLKFNAIDIGVLQLPFKVIANLRAADDQTPAPAGGAAEDVLALKNGDVVSGVFNSATATTVQMQLDTGNVNIDLARVSRLTLGGRAPVRTIPSLSAALAFINGSTLTTDSLHWTPEGVTVHDPSGQDIKLSPDQIISAEILGARVVWLSQLDPSRDQQVSLLSAPLPTRRNRNVMGDALQVAHQKFDRGLGVHTQSTLVYDLDGSFSTLALRCGLDDSAAPAGQAKPTIILDGKIIWTPKNQTMKAGEISDPITLNITGGKKLELHADPGEKFDVLGRFDWLAPALTRP
jgi:hypothetical protein